MAVRYAVEAITPERAKGMLQRLYHDSGTLDQGKVDAYSEVMASFGWVMNGVPLVLDPDERVLDGEYRLRSCVQADVPFTTLVAYGVNADTVHTIDQHRRRSFDQVLQARNVENSGAFMRVLSKIIRYENGVIGIGNKPIPWSVYDAVIVSPVHVEFDIPSKSGSEPATRIRAHTVGEAISEALNLSKSLTLGGRRLSCVHHTARPVFLVMSMLSGKGFEGYDFLDQASMYETGLLKGSEQSEIKTAVTQLVELAITYKNQKFEMDIDDSLGITIQHFNHHLKGQPVPASESVYRKNYGDAASGYEPGDPPPPLPKVREFSPPNLGLPRLTGYPGIPAAEFGRGNPNFKGHTAAILIEAAKASPGAGEDVVRVVNLDTKTAADWLERYNSGNRRTHKTQISSIASDIVNGLWMVNAQPICFSGNPFSDDPGKVRLLNGQHRLEGLLEASKRSGDPDISIVVPVVVGIAENAFATYDIHERRSKASFEVDKVDPRVMLSAAGLIWRTRNESFVRSQMVADLLKPRSEDPSAALKLITLPLYWDRIFSHPGTPSTTEKNQIVKELNDLMTECYKLSRTKDFSDLEIPLGVLTAFMTLILHHAYPVDAAKLFLDYLGDLQKPSDKKDPILSSKRTKPDGVPSLTRLDFIKQKDPRLSKRHDFLSELILTWRAHAEHNIKPGSKIETNLVWPARSLDDPDLDLASHLTESQMETLRAELSRQNEMSMRIHGLAVQDAFSRSQS